MHDLSLSISENMLALSQSARHRDTGFCHPVVNLFIAVLVLFDERHRGNHTAAHFWINDCKFNFFTALNGHFLTAHAILPD